jgi:hypothetical protein
MKKVKSMFKILQQEKSETLRNIFTTIINTLRGEYLSSPRNAAERAYNDGIRRAIVIVCRLEKMECEKAESTKGINDA